MLKVYRVSAAFISVLLMGLLVLYLYVEKMSTRLTLFSLTDDAVPVTLLKVALVVVSYGLLFSSYLTVIKSERLRFISFLINVSFVSFVFALLTKIFSFNIDSFAVMLVNGMILGFIGFVIFIALLIIVQTARGVYDNEN